MRIMRTRCLFCAGCCFSAEPTSQCKGTKISGPQNISKNVSKNISKIKNISNNKPSGLLLDIFFILDIFLDTFLDIFCGPAIFVPLH